VLPVPAITAVFRNGLRLAVAAVLSLAVLLAGSGVHPVSHCADHAGVVAHADLDGCAADPDQPDDDGDGDGLCLSCHCSCQPLHPGVVVALTVPAPDVAGRVHVDGPPVPDEVFLEVEPPPVRAS
jgi:hypothetical protein